MADSGDLPRLARELIQGETTARRQAAAELLALSRRGYDVGTSAKGPLSQALGDADEAVRVGAARALLDSSTVDAVRRAVAGIDGAPAKAQAEALVAAARAILQRDTAGALAVLTPLMLGTRDTAAPLDVDALRTLAAAVRSGVDVGDQLPRVANVLGGGGAAEWYGALVASLAAAAGLDLDSLRQALDAALDSESTEVAGFAGVALTHAALRAGDATAVADYLGDARWAVREGAATACREAAERGLDLAGVTSALGKALGDASAGVVYQTLGALRAAVERASDLTPAVPALRRAVKKLAYKPGPDQWAFGVQATVGETHTHDEEPRSDAACILARHYANAGEWDAVEAMLRGKGNERAGAGTAMLELKTRGTPAQQQKAAELAALGFWVGESGRRR